MSCRYISRFIFIFEKILKIMILILKKFILGAICTFFQVIFREIKISMKKPANLFRSHYYIFLSFRSKKILQSCGIYLKFKSPNQNIQSKSSKSSGYFFSTIESEFFFLSKTVFDFRRRSFFVIVI